MRRTRWVAVVGVAIGVIAATGCGQNDDGGGTAGTTLTIYSSMPLQGAVSGQTKAEVNGERLALDQVDHRVGKFRIRFVSLDDSLASTGAADPGQAAQNARRAVRDKTAVAFLGAYNSGISKVEIPILNKADILQVSPNNTYVGLTKGGPGSEAGEPGKYYPTGKRNYARVVPKDDLQGAALVVAARDAGCKSIHIWNSKTTFSTGLAQIVSTVAKQSGIRVEGNDGIDIKAPNYRSLAARMKADCFIFTGEIESNGIAAIKDAAQVVHGGLFGPDAMCLNEIADRKTGLPPAVAARYKCTIATLDPKSFGSKGQAFFAAYRTAFNTPHPDPFAIYGYEAMALTLDAIRRAGDKGNDRRAVIDEVFATKNRDSVLGKYSIDPNGDTTLTDYGLYRMGNGVLEFDRVIKARG